MTPPRLSFEFFPPRSLKAAASLRDTVRALEPLAPDYVSVTCGAGGSTSDLTQDTAATLVREHGLRVAAHLTCVGVSKDEAMETALRHAEAGVRDIVALRGDAPEGEAGFTPHPDGFATSVDLVRALAATGRFGIEVGAYPERHPDANSDTADVTWLKRKIDAGARGAITQFFFEADVFLRFRDRCLAAGISAPLTPGILPIQDFDAAARLAARCGASIPDRLRAAFEAAGDDRQAAATLAQAECTALCTRLVREGVAEFHFYTLNAAPLTRAVCEALADPATLAEVA